MRARCCRVQSKQGAVGWSICALQRYKRVVIKFARGSGEGMACHPLTHRDLDKHDLRSRVQAGGPLQSFYNAALYGGVPLPYNFPAAAAATDTAIDPAAAVTAAVSAAAASLPADGATQVTIHLFGDVRMMWHQLAVWRRLRMCASPHAMRMYAVWMILIPGCCFR